MCDMGDLAHGTAGHADRTYARADETPAQDKERLRKRRRRLEEDAERAQMNRQRYNESNHPSAAAIEETERKRMFVGLSFRGPAHDRRAWVVWAGLDVWELIEAYNEAGYEELLKEGEISKKALDLALRYYQEYPDEIDQAISENARPPQEWHKLYPDIIPTVP